MGKGTLTLSWRLPRAEDITADQVRAINRATPAALLGAIINATIVAVSLSGSVPGPELIFWYVATCLIASYGGCRWRKTRSREINRVSGRLLKKVTLLAILLALPWTVLVAL